MVFITMILEFFSMIKIFVIFRYGATKFIINKSKNTHRSKIMLDKYIIFVEYKEFIETISYDLLR